MRRAGLKTLGPLLVLLAFSGCAVKPAPPPVTSLNSVSCQALATVAPTAIPLTEAGDYAVAPAADCLIDSDGQRTTGKLFALPSFKPGYWIDLASLAHNASILPLRIQTLDPQRRPVRTLDSEQIYYRGTQLSGQLFFNQDNADERYLLVTAAPSLIGTTTTHNVMTSRTETRSTGLVTFNLTRGMDNTATLTYAYDGALSVRIGGYPAAP